MLNNELVCFRPIFELYQFSDDGDQMTWSLREECMSRSQTVSKS